MHLLPLSCLLVEIIGLCCRCNRESSWFMLFHGALIEIGMVDDIAINWAALSRIVSSFWRVVGNVRNPQLCLADRCKGVKMSEGTELITGSRLM